jgi:hypothetical protein
VTDEQTNVTRKLASLNTAGGNGPITAVAPAPTANAIAPLVNVPKTGSLNEGAFTTATDAVIPAPEPLRTIQASFPSELSELSPTVTVAALAVNETPCSVKFCLVYTAILLLF